LREALEGEGIGYLHAVELAPTTELRRLQYAEDARLGVGIRSRSELSAGFRDGYVREVLGRADLGGLVERLPREGAAALLCVERDPAACHRSLVAERLAADYRLAVEHLTP
jgi:hypothetical protein